MKRYRFMLIGLLLIITLVAGLTGCRDKTESEQETTTEITTGEPASTLEVSDAAGARDKAISLLIAELGETAPALDAGWDESDITGAGIAGDNVIQYISGNWLIVVSYPDTVPERAQYTVMAIEQQQDWYWKGIISAEGKVNEVVMVQQVTMENSRAIAEGFIRNSPTYLFDGIEDSLALVDTVALAVMPLSDIETAARMKGWVFTFAFNSSSAGFGDRTGQMVAEVITPHAAVVAVEQLEVASAVLDNTWDMLEQVEVGSNEQRARELAEQLVTTCPTFAFDGIPETLMLVETLYPDYCENCFQFVYEFDSSHSGYGNRTGQMLAQVITHHRVVITIEDTMITGAIMDETWDMMDQAVLGETLDPIRLEVFSPYDREDVELKAGQSLVLRIESNPTTGFEWELAENESPTVLTLISNDYEPAEEGEIGGGGMEVWTFSALQKGTTSVRMEYSRPWEGGEKGVEFFVMGVTVH